MERTDRDPRLPLDPGEESEDVPTVELRRSLPDAEDPHDEETGEDETTSYLAIQAFVALWSSLLDGETHAAAVLHRDDFSCVYHNARCRELFEAFTPAQFKQALPPALLTSVDRGVVWEGPSDPPRMPGLRLVAIGLGAVGGKAEGIYLTWLCPAEEPERVAYRDAVRQVLDLGSDLVIGVDATRRVVYRNELARRFFPKELLGQQAEEVLHGSAIGALDGKESEPEPTIDVEGVTRVLRWRGATIRVGASTRGAPVELRTTLAMGRDVTREQESAQEIRVRVRRLEAMHAISLAIGRGVSLPDVYAMALARLGEVLPLRQAKLYRVEGAADGTDAVGTQTLKGVYALDQGRGRPLFEAHSLVDHPASEAVGRRVPVQRQTAGPPALRWPMLAHAAQNGIHAVLAVPLLVEHEAKGVLWLLTANWGGFSSDDIEAAEEVAAQLANAVAHQDLLAQIERHAKDLERRVDERTRELRSTQSQLLQAAKLSSIGEMASGLAHELNQPLNVLSGYIELLGEEGVEGAQADRAIDVMAKAAERMTSLVAHLRNFSRTTGQDLRSVDLREIVEMARELTSRASRRPVEVVFERPPEPVVVHGDSGRLEQLVINLVANAMQATEENGGSKVEIDITELGTGEVALEIFDQGPGVDPKIREQIFEPFFTTKPRGSGTGLGLSIGSKIAQEHGGAISVHDGRGGGALFRVTLPKAPRH